MSRSFELGDRIIALSASPPNDIGRLGFPTTEFDRIVFDLCARIVRYGGRVLYGGHLREGSLTAQMYEYAAKAYAPQSLVDEADRLKPFLHLLPLCEFRRTNFARLRESQTNFGSFVETRLVLSDDRHATLGRRHNAIVTREGDKAETTISKQTQLVAFAKTLPKIDEKSALTAMRVAASRLVGARIVIGGKRGDLGASSYADRFDGEMPGVYEETLSSIRDSKPTVVLGAYGGAARDVAIDLGLVDEAHHTPYLGEVQAGCDEARTKMRDLRTKLEPADRDAMAGFVLREDSEDLARDVVEWIASRLAVTK